MIKTLGMAMLIAAWWMLADAGAAAPATQPARQLTLDLGNKVTMKLVRIPAGKFLMGSPDTETDRWPNEVQHKVTISKPFYMGVTPVTVDQFAVFVEDSGFKPDAPKPDRALGVQIRDGRLGWKDGASWRTPNFDQKGNHPVVQVSWNDAKAFCDWLSKKSGKTVHLPTEAQWEYACRAGTKTGYPWGDNPDDGKGWANCADQSLKKEVPFPWGPGPTPEGFFSWGDGFVFTSPVGSFRANAFGLYDMIGNVWQWCSDRHGAYPKGAATDPTGKVTGEFRVLRGGGWYSPACYCRAAKRRGWYPDYRNDTYGFRLAMDSE